MWDKVFIIYCMLMGSFAVFHFCKIIIQNRPKDAESNFFQVNSFQCVCPLGYEGQFCQNKKSECTTGICRNGGKCSETPDGFACSCAAGFTGRYCERTINVGCLCLLSFRLVLIAFYCLDDDSTLL